MRPWGWRDAWAGQGAGRPDAGSKTSSRTLLSKETALKTALIHLFLAIEAQHPPCGARHADPVRALLSLPAAFSSATSCIPAPIGAEMAPIMG